MKKIVINISDISYEKFRFESIHQNKSIQEIIENRIFNKGFHPEVLKAVEDWLESEMQKIIME